jgi:cell division protein FtsI (penicillin-binding protein 3)
MTSKHPKSITPSRVQNYWYRQGAVKYFFVLFLLGFGLRIVTINQLNVGPISLHEKARIQADNSNKVRTKARRGDILDRNGDILASSLILKRVNLDPTQVQTPFIPKLAEALLMPESELRAAIEKKLSKVMGRKELIIKKNLKLTSPILENLKNLATIKLKICTTRQKKISTSLLDQALEMASLKDNKPIYVPYNDCKNRRINGVALQTDMQRYYPKSASLAPLLGRVNHDKQGVSGIEAEFDHALAGQSGLTQLTYEKKSQGSYFNPVVINPLRHGQDIKLTIDANIQFHAYSAIKKSVEFHDANSGSAIILAPNGEILAMANYPADDPNDKTIYNVTGNRNRVLLDKVDPGSTMKPFTMLLALDKNKITATEDELIDVSRSIGHVKTNKDVRRHGDAITVKKILEKSHNLGTVNVSERLDKEDVYNTWDKLGFGHPLGIIPSIENSGSLRHFDSWGLADKRSLSYGYGPMEANLAQLARAYLVFANDGAIPPLKLIKDVNIDENMTSIFSKDSTLKIANILDSVASWDGSGYRARIKGYDVAGKTGTAEKIINGKYNKKGINRTFFTGFTPVKNPKYIMAVMLDYPKKCYNYYYPDKLNKCGGGNSAAMTFKDAMENILTTDQSIKLLAKK